MSGNLHDRPRYLMTDMCTAVHPTEKEWICSLARNHQKQHAAYYDHDTSYRSKLYKRWPNEKHSASEDDVAAAIASITGTLKQRQVPVQMPVPIIDDIDRARGNIAEVQQMIDKAHYEGIIADKDALIERLEKERDGLADQVHELHKTLAKIRTRVAHVTDALLDV